MLFFTLFRSNSSLSLSQLNAATHPIPLSLGRVPSGYLLEKLTYASPFSRLIVSLHIDFEILQYVFYSNDKHLLPEYAYYKDMHKNLLEIISKICISSPIL